MRRLICPLLLASALFASGCVHGLEQGTRALRAQDFDRAESIARAELLDDASSPWANLLMAETLTARGDYRRALSYAQRADESGLFPGRAPRLLGEISEKIGLLAEAAEYYWRARTDDPSTVDDEFLLEFFTQGIEISAANRNHHAHWTFLSLLAKLAPDHPEVTPQRLAASRRAYAITLRDTGEYRAAAELLRQALDQDPAYITGEAFDLGEIYARLNLPEEAEEAWQTYLAGTSDSSERIQRHFDVTLAAANHSRFGLAIDALEAILPEVDSTLRGPRQLDLAYYQLRADRDDDARQTLENFIADETAGSPEGVHPVDPYRRAAELALRENRPRIGIQILERGTTHAQASQNLTRQLADLYARRAQLGAVEEVLNRFIDKNDNPLEALLFAASWAKDRRNHELSRHFLTRASESPDASPEVFLDLASVHGDLENYDEMTQAVLTYLKQAGRTDEALTEAATLFSNHRAYEEAEPLLIELRRRQPESLDSTTALATLYRRWGRPLESIQVWESWIKARGSQPGDMEAVAQTMSLAGELDQAARFYRMAAQAGYHLAWLRAAEIYMQQDDQAAMIVAFEAYLESHSDREMALQEVASRYSHAGLKSRQIEAIRELTQLRPHNWNYHATLTTLLLEQGLEYEALQLLTEFVRRAPNTFEALAQTGERFSNIHYPYLLIDLYSQWLDGDQTHPTVWRLLGDAYYNLSRQESSNEARAQLLRQAHDHYLRFVHSAEDNENWQNLAMNWQQRQMWRPAALAFERISPHSRPPQNIALAHAETLLHLGEPERAEELLSSLVQNDRGRTEAAARAARLLHRFQRYEAAKQYAQRLFISGTDEAVIEGYLLLAEIYRQEEDFAALQELITQFPEQVSNRTRAHFLTVTILEDTGRWEQAIKELERFKSTSPVESSVQQALNYIRSGDPEAALNSFEDAAREGLYPAEIWLNAAQRLQVLGEQELALYAFERALQSSPENLIVRTMRGVFLARIGEVEKSLQDYEFALKSSPNFATHLRESFFEAFRDIGRFDLARQVENDAAQSSITFQASLSTERSTWDLRTQDKAVQTQAIEAIRSSSWGVANMSEYLRQTGHQKEILRLAQEEFEEGDPSMGAVILLINASELASVSKWTEFREYLEAIVDPLRRSDTRLIGAVGDYRSRMGNSQEARLFLQAAADYGDQDYLAQLGHTLLNLDEPEEALTYFQTWLLQNPTEQNLESLLLRLELANQADEAAKFLDNLVEEPSLLHIALPQKVHYDLERHADPQRAIHMALTYLERAQRLPSSAFRAPKLTMGFIQGSREQILTLALTRSLETVAALGYLDELARTLTQIELSQTQLDSLVPLRLKIAIARGDKQGAAALVQEHLDAAPGVFERQELRLDLARQFLAFGADDLARELVDAALQEQSDFRSHQPMALHLGLLLLAGEEDMLLQEVQRYLERVPNRLDARRTIIDELHRLGSDKEALTLAMQALEAMPTETHLRQALTIALDQGDKEAVRQLTPLFLRTVESPLVELASILKPRITGSEPDLILPLIHTIRSARQGNLEWQIEEIRLHFLNGDVEEARRLMLQAAETRNYDREAITLIIEMLAQERLDVELARVLAPALPDAALWPGTMVSIAEAEFALGFPDEAQKWLKKLDASALEPALWRYQLGDRLASRHLFQAIPLVVTDVDENAPPHARYLHSLAMIAAGDTEAGLATLREANDDGARVLYTHTFAIPAAIKSGDHQAVNALFHEQIRLPIKDAPLVSYPLQIALHAAMDTPGGPQAIRTFLEQERPRLADGHGATWTQFAGQLAGAFERTGDPQGAYGFYRDRIWQAQFRGREDRSLSVYLNNLAYTYSTTNHQIDAGIESVYRALILAQDRNYSYIDTLGWLLYRQGDLPRAEDEIRRSLRAYDGPPSGLRELTLHLQELLEQRGAYGEAAWLETKLSRLPTHDFN